VVGLATPCFPAAGSGAGSGSKHAGLRAEAGGLPYDRAVATDNDVRQNALARIDAVQALVHGLPAGSRLRPC
jgi:hypothetical protein